MMDWLLDVSWEQVFVPQAPLLEIVLRGSLMYLFVFALFRIVFKRQAGTWSISDLIVVVFVADASQNAMSNDYTSVADGAALVAVIAFWAFGLDWISYRFRFMERVVKARPLPLVQDGKMIARNMKKELLTPEELMSHLRLSGAHRIEDVELAQMESNGQISVVPKSGGEARHPQRVVT